MTTQTLTLRRPRQTCDCDAYTDLACYADEMEDENSRLEDEVAELRAELARYETAAPPR